MNVNSLGGSITRTWSLLDILSEQLLISIIIDTNDEVLLFSEIIKLCSKLFLIQSSEFIKQILIGYLIFTSTCDPLKFKCLCIQLLDQLSVVQVWCIIVILSVVNAEQGLKECLMLLLNIFD